MCVTCQHACMCVCAVEGYGGGDGGRGRDGEREHGERERVSSDDDEDLPPPPPRPGYTVRGVGVEFRGGVEGVEGLSVGWGVCWGVGVGGVLWRNDAVGFCDDVGCVRVCVCGWVGGWVVNIEVWA